jgi:cell shape-determining protein MreC
LNNEDVVLTSGEDGILKGLLIGKISEVKKEDAGVFQSAKIGLLLDYQNLTQVFVVIGQ